MLKQIIDLGLTALNVAQLINNNQDETKPEKRRKVIENNKKISNIRNVAYVVRRLIK